MKSIIIKTLLILFIVIIPISLYNNTVFADDQKKKTDTASGSESSITSLPDKPSTISDAMDAASSFMDDGEKEIEGYTEYFDYGVKEETLEHKPIQTNLHSTSNFIYNFLLAIGIIAAVAIGTTLGIKFMISSVEGQAKIKELLVPYVAGCIVVFGAFGIWKIAVDILKVF